MPVNSQGINTSKMHDLLMQCKYRDAVKRLARGVTHEYNNIFTGLSGQITISLQEGEIGKISPKRKELIEELLQRGTEQTNILFDFSRESVGSKSPRSPVRLAQKAIDLLNSVSRLHYFELEADSDLPKILSNQRDILLMLFYLGENAIEAMVDGGSVELELSHGPEYDGLEYITFTMSDSGCGFSAKMQETGCEPFTTTKKGCSVDGLGLYAVQSIVVDHGGRVQFQQRAEGGSVVRVDLPAYQISEQPGERNTLSHGAAILQGAPQKHVFFIVDDEESIRDMLLMRLQRRGHMVFCAESCAEAIEEFNHLSDTISVVLLDVWLSDSTGYDCAVKLRAINEKVRIIFMSGQDHDRHKKIGANAPFLKKPFSIEQLEQMVGNVKT
jgi:CheY-like chemotaxis protein/anti-sigma regulatory factor (Ser/Thr protein kinase)